MSGRFGQKGSFTRTGRRFGQGSDKSKPFGYRTEYEQTERTIRRALGKWFPPPPPSSKSNKSVLFQAVSLLLVGFAGHAFARLLYHRWTADKKKIQEEQQQGQKAVAGEGLEDSAPEPLTASTSSNHG